MSQSTTGRIRSLRRGLRVAVVLATFFAISFTLGRLGRRDLESTAMDFWSRTHDRRADPRTVVVHITDEDYASLFNRESPLDPSTVLRVVDAIAKGGPRVIGVDLLTHDAVWASMNPQDSVPAAWGDAEVTGMPEVVWAQALGPCPEGEEDPCPLYLRSPRPVLGGAGGARATGLALLQPDADGFFRTYQRYLPAPSALLRLFPAELAARYDPALEELPRTADRLVIDYRPPDDLRLTASRVLELAESEGWTTGILKDQVVLLGGAFREARDMHRTPLGPQAGVEIMAQIVETELRGGGVEVPGRPLLWAIEVLLGIGLILAVYVRGPLFVLAASVVFVPGLMIAGSLLAFGTWRMWAYFAPMILAVLLAELFSLAKRSRNRLLAGVAAGGKGDR